MKQNIKYTINSQKAKFVVNLCHRRNTKVRVNNYCMALSPSVEKSIEFIQNIDLQESTISVKILRQRCPIAHPGAAQER